MLRLPDSVLDALLREDVPHGDLTTHLLGLAGRAARMGFAARTAQTLALVEEAQRLVELAGGEARILAPSGSQAVPGQPVLAAEGPAEALFVAWKVAQTLIESASGIATNVQAMVLAAKAGGGAVVACTRKPFPGTRAVALKAVMAGGGTPHRLGLSDSILIFPEHRAFLDGADIKATVAAVKAASPERKVVAEVKTEEEALLLAEAGIDALQLEKFTPEAVAEVKRGLDARGLGVVLAAAGGVNAANAADYVRAGAAVLVTSAPYWARPTEIAVGIEPASGTGRHGE